MKRQLLCATTVMGALLGTGCVGISMQDRDKTQIVTFPTNADIELNGKRLGQSPVLIEIPHDENGKVRERTIVRAIPKSTNEFVQVREFTADRVDPLPLRVMIDMRREDTNATSVAFAEPEARIASASADVKERLLSPRARSNQ